MEWFADGFRVELVEPRDRVEHLIMGWTTDDADAKWNSPGGGEPSVFSDTQREIMRKMERAVKLLAAAFEFVIKFYISADFKLSSIKQAYFRNSLNGQCGNQILNWYEKQKILLWVDKY
jgi:hypothetical protein